MSTSATPPTVSVPNRWAVLALLGVAQLMVVLDATIVNIALPSAQKALHFSAENRQWAITAYALTFGSLLLLGGKLGDLFGRKWTFIGGLIGFAVASAIGGMAQSFGMLVRRPRPARCVRRAARPLGARTADRDLPRLERPAEGVWHLQRDRGWGRIARAPARRRSHPGDLLALVPVRQPGHRYPHRDRRAPAAAQRAPARPRED